MLTISSQQIEAFEKQALLRFEDEMILHCQDFTPELSRVLGESQLRVAVRHAFNRADSYGFTTRGAMRLYLEMCLLFGSSFDSDPQYPWAAQILSQPIDQMQRAEQLFQRIIDYQNQVSGPDACHAMAALRQLPIVCQQPMQFSSENFAPAMQALMTQIYPQKSAYVGTAAIQQLVQQACMLAQRLDFQSSRAYALIVLLMYGFGHGCYSDPLYPWIGTTLSDPKIATPVARAERLERKSLTWLDHVLANFSAA